MKVYDDTVVIPYKKLLRKKKVHRTNGFSLSRPKEKRTNPYIKNGTDPEEELPMHKWIMPPQPERYVKYSDHDLL